MWYGISPWPVWVCCPGFSPSQNSCLLPAYYSLREQSMRKDKASMLCKSCSAMAKRLLCQQCCCGHRTQNTAAYGLLWRELLHPSQTLYMNSKRIGQDRTKKISHHLSRLQALSGRAAESDHLQAFILSLDIAKLILLVPHQCSVWILLLYMITLSDK